MGDRVADRVIRIEGLTQLQGLVFRVRELGGVPFFSELGAGMATGIFASGTAWLWTLSWRRDGDWGTEPGVVTVGEDIQDVVLDVASCAVDLAAVPLHRHLAGDCRWMVVLWCMSVSLELAWLIQVLDLVIEDLMIAKKREQEKMRTVGKSI
jgi:hypothetical protein